MSQHTALYDKLAQSGAAMGENHGWNSAIHFGDPSLEYRQARESAAIFDRGDHGFIEAVGPEAGKFLHNLCTNDVNGLQGGRGCEAFLTTAQAKIVGYVVIDRLAQTEANGCFRVDTGPGLGSKLFQHLDRYLISEKLELRDRCADLTMLHLAGPDARGILERATGLASWDLTELHHAMAQCDDHPWQVRRHDLLGVPGYDLIGPQEAAGTIWLLFRDAGAHAAGQAAYDMLRIEAGTPVYGQDIDQTNLPQEVGRIERTISFTKGCYIGQETVARIRAYGHVNRLLIGVKFGGVQEIPPGTKLLRGDQTVGQVTSSVISPRIRVTIALAYIRRDHAQAGTELEAAAETGRLRAEVVSLPFA